MLLDKLNKQIAEELMKVNNVHYLLGSKRLAARLVKVDDDALVATLTYKHKKKSRFIFKRVSLINSDNDEVIQRRKTELTTMTKGDSITIEWTVSVEQTGEVTKWGH